MSSQLYQIAQQSHTQMMGYVLRTGNRLLVIDGGTAHDAPYLLKLLKTLGGEKPHIDAWFLTHAHSDHIDAFLALSPELGRAFTLGALYHHFPDPSFILQHEPKGHHTIETFQRLDSGVLGLARRLQHRQTLTFDAAVFEVLYVSDPRFTHNAINNSSTVLRLTLEGVTVLFLGDLGKEGGDKLLEEYGTALRSDAVQMAHHGQGGVDLPVYSAIAPSVCLWCTPLWLWENNIGGKGIHTGPWTTPAVAAHMFGLGVERHIIAKDGTYRLDLAEGRITAECIDPHAAL